MPRKRVQSSDKKRQIDKLRQRQARQKQQYDLRNIVDCSETPVKKRKKVTEECEHVKRCKIDQSNPMDEDLDNDACTKSEIRPAMYVDKQTNRHEKDKQRKRRVRATESQGLNRLK